MAVSTFDLTCPLPGDTVGYTFTASGFVTFDAVLAANLPITVTLKNSSGATIDTKTCTAFAGSTTAVFAVIFTVTQDFDDCTLEATITFPPAVAVTNTDQVQNIDIDDNSGGFFNLVLPPLPVLIPTP